MEAKTQTTQTTEKTQASPKFKITKMHIIGIVLLIVILGVVYVAISSSAAPVVAAGDNVSVNYTGTFTNGTVFDSSAGRAPLNFTAGAGEVIPGFDNAVIGMKLHEEKTVTIPANEAYGPVNPELIVTVPRSSFGNQTPEAGMQVTQTTTTGEQLTGTVTKVNSTNVTVDFNPPLAGQTLIFKIQIVAIHKK
jgi:peptidylprolyl isomerase